MDIQSSWITPSILTLEMSKFYKRKTKGRIKRVGKLGIGVTSIRFSFFCHSRINIGNIFPQFLTFLEICHEIGLIGIVVPSNQLEMTRV